MANETRSQVSRRNFLRGSAVLVGASLVGMDTFINIAAAKAQGGDVDALNYALTLEHLEYAFYRDGLNQFNTGDAFAFLSNRPGGGADVISLLSAIRDHEKAHVDTLTSVIWQLGGTPVGEAQYKFGYSTAKEFVAVAQALENTGVAAYDGALAAIQSPDLQTAAATIATVEARHAAYLNYLNYTIPFPASFDKPQTQAQILRTAGQFIVS